MATTQVEAFAPIDFLKLARIGLVDFIDFDTDAQGLAYAVSNGVMHSSADNQNCGWFAPASHLANMVSPARLEDLAVTVPGDLFALPN
jgi:hypothetical protein